MTDLLFMAVGARGQQLSARTLDARSLLLLGMKRCADCGHGVPFSGWPRNRRRARLRDAFVEHIDPFVVYDRDDGRCGVCGRDVPRDRFDIDHIEPLACGGKHAYINVRLAHVACNRSRGRQVASARA